MEYVNLSDLIVAAKNNRCGDCDFPVLSITKNDGIVLQSEKFKKRIASKDTANYKVVHRGQLVQGIHIDEANFGIQEVVDIGIVSPAYKIWDIKRNAIVPKYLEVVLRSPRSIAYYASKFNGSIKRRERLSDKDFLQMRIPCPSVDEQIYAIEVLDKTIALIDSRKQQLSELDNFIKARFVEMFGDPIGNPMGWPTQTMKNASVRLSDGPFGSNLKSAHYTAKGVRVIRLGNIGCGYFNDADKSFIPEEHYEKLKKYTCRAGEIIIATLGDPNLRACLIPSYVEFGINKSDCVHYIPKANLLNNQFVCQYINCPETLTLASGMIHGQTRARISSGQLADLPIFLPPMNLQEQFAAFVEQTDKSKVVVQKALNEAQILFDSLMQQYFG